MSTNPFAASAPGTADGHAASSTAPSAGYETRLPSRLPDGGTTSVGFGTLLAVELRKVVDTRAGKVLLAVTAALIILISGIVAYNERDDIHFVDLISAAFVPMNFLIPILGIMTVTSEWTQRTGLVTFTLEPRRFRVVLAKWAAVALLAIGATLVAMASAALFTAIMGAVGSGSPDWHLNGAAYGTLFLSMLLEGSMGVAFGLLIQNTPGAICAFLFIPVIVSMVNLVSWGQKLAEWINPNQAFGPLTDGSVNGSEWGKVAVCAALWIALPLVVGLVRLNRREVKSS